MLVKMLAGLAKPVIATSTREAVPMLGIESLCVAFCQDDLPGNGFQAVLRQPNGALC